MLYSEMYILRVGERYYLVREVDGVIEQYPITKSQLVDYIVYRDLEVRDCA